MNTLDKARKWLETAWDQETTEAERIVLVDLIIRLHQADALTEIAALMATQVEQQPPPMSDEEIAKALYNHP